jgi:Ca2+-binding RTX toxin-like protein
MMVKASSIGVSILASVVLMCLTSGMKAWADSVRCQPLPEICYGTSGNDNIKGTNQADSVFGEEGNDHITVGDGNDFVNGNGATNTNLDDDNIAGGDGDDSLAGEEGNDRINGGPGDDKVYGGAGIDRINSGPGNDYLTHGYPGTFAEPDGSRDVIDCGDGTDEVYINVNVDHDSAVNCETVHSG